MPDEKVHKEDGGGFGTRGKLRVALHTTKCNRMRALALTVVTLETPDNKCQTPGRGQNHRVLYCTMSVLILSPSLFLSLASLTS